MKAHNLTCGRSYTAPPTRFTIDLPWLLRRIIRRAELDARSRNPRLRREAQDFLEEIRSLRGERSGAI